MSRLAVSTVNRPRRLAALVAACLASLLLTAEAQADPVFVSQLGSGTGSAAGQIKYPWGVAVNPTSGDIYLADDFTNNRVDEYSSTGAFVRAWGWGVADGQSHFEICTTTCQGGAYNHAGGAFDGIRAITVDTTSGNVYVADGGDNRIDEFSSTGAFIQDFGMGVADGNPNKLETCSATCTYGQGGVLSSPTGIAFDPVSGNLYVVSGSQNAVSEFTPSGGFVKEYGWGVADGASHFETCTTVSSCQAGPAGGGAGQLMIPQGVAVDSHGSVYVADAGNNRIDEFSTGGTFIKADGWGVLDGASKSETCTATCQAGLAGGGAGEIATPYAIAVDTAGDVYVAEYSEFSGVANRVDEFAPSGSFMLTFGWRVGADSQLKFEVCRTGCQGGLAGGGNGEFFQASGLALAGAHSLYVTDQYPAVQKFDVSASQPKPPSCSLASTGKVTILSDGQGTLPAHVLCNQRATARLKGTLTDTPVGAATKRVALSPVKSVVRANVKHTFKLTLPASAMRDLKHGAAESVAMNLTATNANGISHRALKVALHR